VPSSDSRLCCSSDAAAPFFPDAGDFIFPCCCCFPPVGLDVLSAFIDPDCRVFPGDFEVGSATSFSVFPFPFAAGCLFSSFFSLGTSAAASSAFPPDLRRFFPSTSPAAASYIHIRDPHEFKDHEISPQRISPQNPKTPKGIQKEKANLVFNSPLLWILPNKLKRPNFLYFCRYPAAAKAAEAMAAAMAAMAAGGKGEQKEESIWRFPNEIQLEKRRETFG